MCVRVVRMSKVEKKCVHIRPLMTCFVHAELYFDIILLFVFVVVVVVIPCQPLVYDFYEADCRDNDYRTTAYRFTSM